MVAALRALAARAERLAAALEATQWQLPTERIMRAGAARKGAAEAMDPVRGALAELLDRGSGRRA